MERHQAHRGGPARLEAHLLDEILVAEPVELAHERREVAPLGGELARRGERLDEVSGAAVADRLRGGRGDPPETPGEPRDRGGGRQRLGEPGALVEVLEGAADPGIGSRRRIEPRVEPAADRVKR